MGGEGEGCDKLPLTAHTATTTDTKKRSVSKDRFRKRRKESRRSRRGNGGGEKGKSSKGRSGSAKRRQKNIRRVGQQ